MSKLVFTESSDDAVWDFEDDATRWVDNCPDLTHAEEMEGAVLGYRAGAAASEARIKALEEEVRELKEALTATVMQATARQIPITNEIKFSAPIRAALKEDDQ